MLYFPQLARLIPICLVLVMGWGGNAEAHRRGGLPLVRPAPSPVAQAPASSAPAEENLTAPLSLQPDAYWQRLIAQERAGELKEARKTGLALVNLFPQAQKRGSALLKLAELVKREGKSAEALELYALAAALTAGAPEGVQACLAASALQFSRDLPQGDPVQTLGRFLKKISALPPGSSSEMLSQTLITGWQAVAHKVRSTSPLPLSLVEEILALWELQPKGLGPPEAARLLADLLKEKGLWEAAQTLAAQADNVKAEPRRMVNIQPSEIPWLSGKWPGMAPILAQINPGEEVQQSFLGSWLAGGRAGFESGAAADEVLPGWFSLTRAPAPGLKGQIPAWGPNLLPLRAGSPTERLHVDLARCSLPERPLVKASRSGQSPATAPLTEDLGPFHQDRLGVSHLQDGQPEAAEATFQGLSQHDDPFWRRLARVRLADLELSRLQAKPSP
jgi:tetratricopeptide (TPR) repeat protein